MHKMTAHYPKSCGKLTARPVLAGFAVIELVLVIGMVVIIAALGTAPVLFFKKTNALNTAALTSMSLLKDARVRALSSMGGVAHGVHFADESATLFSGDTFNGGAVDNEVTSFGTFVETSRSLNGGGDEVVFTRLTGETEEYGTITFRLKSDVAKTKVLYVGQMGTIKTD
ncbi:MAG: hypothetical protein A3D67_01070 [Candidatus Lloydbacteria bacterium RIFCSPHIGHO2_02_FULL_51_22]|uniref:General secretion pathway GspH domain-containing protein n=2 Tax=Candidatus Lloydiibacteriota TaxID=1817910 RepID=A0A1G2DBT7_9BACT|nr:MAG: hypothetical protein A3D67_01070 [Candidatus Lloydbacteria bacterium RIFCSPHIGHO2_02_FULL_51_22]OGZ16933.1 MAG: hypothetical protein A3G11_00795 [Candidatus Lloydbacteria bacterium RIFCSPLOWO2_12_FULL_51_9]